MKDLLRPVTADELSRMKDSGMRRELVRGEVREMPPTGGEHGSVTGTLHSRLGHHVLEAKLGHVLAAETGFVIERDPDTVRAADCAFVSTARLSGKIPRKYLPFAPDLAVETLSPDDRAREVADKVAQWLKAGTRLVWVLDPERRTATVHRPGREPRVLRDGDFLDGEEVVPGFRLAVAELWV